MTKNKCKWDYVHHMKDRGGATEQGQLLAQGMANSMWSWHWFCVYFYEKKNNHIFLVKCLELYNKRSFIIKSFSICECEEHINEGFNIFINRRKEFQFIYLITQIFKDWKVANKTLQFIQIELHSYNTFCDYFH